MRSRCVFRVFLAFAGSAVARTTDPGPLLRVLRGRPDLHRYIPFMEALVEWVEGMLFLIVVALAAVAAAPVEVALLLFGGESGPQVEVAEARGDGAALIAACMERNRFGLLLSADPDDRWWADGWAAVAYYDTIVWRLDGAPRVRTLPWPQSG